MGHTDSAFYLWLSFIRPLRVQNVWLRKTKRAAARTDQWWKKGNKSGELQPFSSSFFLSSCPCLFRSPVSQFRHAMTVTVVYKSPFPWTVSACLLWDETTAIRSSARQIPALSALLLSQSTPRPTIERCTGGAAHTHTHFKPSGLFSGKVQIKHY